MDWPAGERFEAGGGHHVWWAEGGDPAGHPVVMLHGGPGGRSRAEAVAWWRGLPVRWIVIDQRGCGRSTPAGETGGNTLQDLLDDLDRLRARLGLSRWALAGGSWGAVVALASLLRDPDRVDGLFLRSPFLATPAELERYLEPWDDWLGEPGRRALGADAARLPRWLRTPPGGPGAADDRPVDEAGLAQAWAGFDDLQSQPGGVRAADRRWVPAAPAGRAAVDPAVDPAGKAAGQTAVRTTVETTVETAARTAAKTAGGGADPVPAPWRIFSHYARHGWFLQEPLLPALHRLAPAARGGPLAVLCGQRDACCDPDHGERLARWRDDPGTQRVLVPEGGHRMDQPVMSAALRALAAAWVARLGA